MTEFQLLRQDLDISRAIMLTTIIVAITSIVFSSITMAFERSHNIKSVRPFFNLLPSMTNHSISLTIMNAGLGPMLINRLVLVKKNDIASPVFKSLSEVLPPELGYDALFTYSSVYVLASNEMLKLFEYSENDSLSSKNILIILEILGNYSLYLDYQDVYERDYQRKAEICF